MNKQKIKKYLSAKSEKDYNILDLVARDSLSSEIAKIIEDGKLPIPLYEFFVDTKFKSKKIDYINISFQYCNIFVDLSLKEGGEYICSAFPINKKGSEDFNVYEEGMFESYEKFIEFLQGLLKKIRGYKSFNSQFDQRKIDREALKKEKKIAKNITFFLLGAGLLMVALYFILDAKGKENSSLLVVGIACLLPCIFNLYYIKSKKVRRAFSKKTILIDFEIILIGLVFWFALLDIIKNQIKPFVIILYVGLILLSLAGVIAYFIRDEKK